MSDRDRIRQLRKQHVELSIVLDEAAENLINCKDRLHGVDRQAILQLAKFLEGDAEQPFPEER